MIERGLELEREVLAVVRRQMAEAKEKAQQEKEAVVDGSGETTTAEEVKEMPVEAAG